jgi:TPR repeat protein
MKGDKFYKAALSEVKKEGSDIKLVLKLLNQAIDKGNYNASYALGTWYLHGTNVKKDFHKAFDLVKRATEIKLPSACFDLAVCYETGQGVEKNEKEAFKYYLLAALEGEKQSIYEVGRCYYYGIGIDENKEIGQIWLDRARKMGIRS